MKKRKKKSRQRGSGTHGYGSKKKHRGGGSRGGRGKAGSKKHKRYNHMKNWGSKGFASRKKEEKSINIKQVLRKFPKKKKIDLTKRGYNKLIALGKVNRPLEITVKKASKTAQKRIEEAGGSIETER